MVNVFVTNDKLYFPIQLTVSVNNGENEPVEDAIYSNDQATSFVSYPNNNETKEFLNTLKLTNAKKDRFYYQTKLKAGTNGQYYVIDSRDVARLKDQSSADTIKLEMLITLLNDLDENTLEFSDVPEDMNGFTAQGKITDLFNSGKVSTFDYIMRSDETFTITSSEFDFKSGQVYAFESKYTNDGTKWARELL